MKRIFKSFILLGAGIIATGSRAEALAPETSNEELTIAVVSDVHVMSPELMVEEGKAFSEYLANDRKMLLESAAILDEMTERLLASKPHWVLFPGDLTKDGELLSHQYLNDNMLSRLHAAGIKTLVAPGNHDINNPDAVEFLGDTTRRVATVQPADFARIYSASGYGDTLARDTASLSYVHKLNDELQVLTIDACRYEDNDFEKPFCYYDGRVRAATYDFIESQLLDAEQRGVRTIAMMHHGVVEHWDYQEEMLPGYIVADSKRLAKLLRKYGVELCFTGHSHSQDVSMEKGLYDVQTGSIVSFPLPYRMVTINDKRADIKSFTIDEIDFNLKGVSLRDHARQASISGFRPYIDAAIPKSIKEETRAAASDMLAEGMIESYAGDESIDKVERKERRRVTGAIAAGFNFKWAFIFNRVSKSVLIDPSPRDNELVIEFQN